MEDRCEARVAVVRRLEGEVARLVAILDEERALASEIEELWKELRLPIEGVARQLWQPWIDYESWMHRLNRYLRSTEIDPRFAEGLTSFAEPLESLAGAEIECHGHLFESMGLGKKPGVGSRVSASGSGASTPGSGESPAPGVAGALRARLLGSCRCRSRRGRW